jgi:hypothetical protein
MNIDKWVFRIAGSMILMSLLLSWVHSHHWLWFTAFLGANMLQASFTGFCPSVYLLKAFKIKPGKAFE